MRQIKPIIAALGLLTIASYAQADDSMYYGARDDQSSFYNQTVVYIEPMPVSAPAPTGPQWDGVEKPSDGHFHWYKVVPPEVPYIPVESGPDDLTDSNAEPAGKRASY